MLSSTEKDRNLSIIAKALARIEANPALYKSKTVKQGKNNDPIIFLRVADLDQNVEGISVRQISTLLQLSKSLVGRAVQSSETEPEWSTDNNETSAASELASLKAHHPGGYINEIDLIGAVENADADEVIDIPEFLSAPPFQDRYRRADQTHTIKRPITLATRPYEVAA